MSYPDNLTDFELGYIVGLFEGEGHITCAKQSKEDYQYKDGRRRRMLIVQIGISNNSLKTLEKIQNILKIGNITMRSKSYEHHKQGYIWRLTRIKEIYYFLKLIRKYLIIKKEKAELLIPYLKSRVKNQGKNHTEKELEFFTKYYKLKSFRSQGGYYPLP